MFSRIERTRRSNHSIFLQQNFGSPFNDTAEHLTGLGLARIDFERCAVAGEVVYTVEGDSTPTSQQDEEARIATLAHALKKLGNPEDAAEFMCCLNAICEEGDARYRQVAASYYYGEIAERGAGPVLKEMALIAMHLASLNPVAEEVETDPEVVYALREGSKPRSFFDREVAAVERMIRGRRKSAGFVHDEWTEWLNDLEANGASVDELDDAFAHVEALDQYEEGGAIVRMSVHERTFACGSLDHEFTADDLPEQARFLAGDLFRAYTAGVELDEIWDEIYLPRFLPTEEQLRVLAEIDNGPWLGDLRRRVQHYGYKYDYRARSISHSMRVGPLPPFAVEVAERLTSCGLITEFPDQAIVNEYQPGRELALTLIVRRASRIPSSRSVLDRPVKWTS